MATRRKAVLRVTVVGALLFLLTLLLDDGLYCMEECNAYMMADIDNAIAMYIREHVIDPPQETPPHPLEPHEVEEPIFKNFGAWSTVMSFIMMHAAAMGRNKTFVEVGSGDGQFLSFTSQLEVLLGWQGLMIEPREDAYKQARQRRRAAGANVCVGSTDFHAKETLWTPRADKDLPPLLQQATASRTVLKRYVPQEDLPDGDDWVHQCYRLEALVAAYRISANITDKPIDLLVIDANAGELEMFDMLVNPVYRVVALHLSSKSYGSLAEFLAGTMNMRMVDPLTISFSHIIFLHKDIDLVDKTVQNSSLYTKISK